MLLVAEEDVLGDRQVGAQRQLLVDDDDAHGLGIPDGAEFADVAVIDDLALVGPARPDAGENVHESGLAGAVLAAHGVDLTAADIEGDVVERLELPEGLGDVPHPEDEIVRLPARNGLARLARRLPGHSPTSSAV